MMCRRSCDVDWSFSNFSGEIKYLFTLLLLILQEEDEAIEEVEMEGSEQPYSQEEMKYLSIVRKDPSDFTSWTCLLQLVEQKVSCDPVLCHVICIMWSSVMLCYIISVITLVTMLPSEEMDQSCDAVGQLVFKFWVFCEQSLNLKI